MAKIGAQRVGYEGPKEGYEILIVGEAPGGEEVGQGRPFVGKAGHLLERYLARAGRRRGEVRLANLCQYRPAENQFRNLLKSTQLEEGLADLREEISHTKPNLILGLGNWPLWFLTGNCAIEERGKNHIKKPGNGIGLYRGSRLRCLPEYGGGKFFATYHPSFVERVWSVNPIFHQDITNAVEDSTYPELRYPEYDEFIDPDHSDTEELLHEALNAPWISVDIETFPNHTFSCIGWSWQLDGKDRAVTVTFKAPHLWHFAKKMWESRTPKIFQYGTYDISFMRQFYGWKPDGYYDGVGWDTYVASASIYPDYPRGLDFLASMYTRFPYYKTDRKIWREVEDMNILWKYNIKDVVATMHVALGQMKDMRRLHDNAT